MPPQPTLRLHRQAVSTDVAPLRIIRIPALLQHCTRLTQAAIPSNGLMAGSAGIAQQAQTCLPDIARTMPEQYEQQLQQKAERVRLLYSDWTVPELQVHRSPPEHYRMRAEFSLWRDKGELYYIMHDKPGQDSEPPREASSFSAAPEARQAAEQAGGLPAHADKSATTSTEPPKAAPETGTRGQVTGQKRRRQGPVRVRVDQFPRGSSLMNELMAGVISGISGSQVLSNRLFQANFHTTLSGDAMVTLLYHKKLDAAWRDAAQQLRSALASSCPSFQSAAAPQSLADGHTPPEPAAGQPKTAADPSAQQQGRGSGPQEGQADSTAADTPPPPSTAANKDSLDQLDESPLPGLMGRSRGMRITLGRDFVTEQLPLGQRHLSYRQLEGAFSQPNGAVCKRMLQWAVQVTEQCKGDLLELYCGNGNFTLALAPNFGSVVATEVAKPSVAAALHNAAQNGISNVHIARLSSEEFVQAWRGHRVFNRLEGLDLKQFNFNTLFLDPPRAGLDPETEKLLPEFDNIMYVSCNPKTQHANLACIQKSHQVQSFAMFDQFPYTDHVECGIFLTRTAHT